MNLTDAELKQIEIYDLKDRIERLQADVAAQRCETLNQEARVKTLEAAIIEMKSHEQGRNVGVMRSGVEKIRQARKAYMLSLAEKYGLGQSWGFNPETGEIHEGDSNQ